MTIGFPRFKQHLSPFALSAALLLAALSAGAHLAPAEAPAAATVQARISAEPSNSSMIVLPATKRPMAQAQNDTGRLAPATKLQGVSIYFNRTEAQEADLQALIAAQQNHASPLYHQWLTPDEFASRYGMADSDLAKVQSWLERQGFSIDSVGRARNVIHFSGTTAQVEAAFATELHTYAIKKSDGTVENHFAPSTALSVPSALAGVVENIRNLDDFRPHSHIKLLPQNLLKHHYTDGSGSHELAPADIYTIYDINPLYNSGITGTGQTIAIVGQSDISLADVANFRNAAGLPSSIPTKILVPGTGAPYFSSGDEAESDLDLEWSGAIAKSAQLDFVYTGDNSSGGAFDAILYAIDQRIAPIISSSYGDCEIDVGSSNLESSLEQATVQGQTVLSASGDSGSTDCFVDSSLPVSEEGALSVDYPASSPYVTGVGGTQFSGDVSAAGTYWNSSNDASTGSAIQYIPETAWNEDSSSDGLGASGGGVSLDFAIPAWQTGAGVVAGGRNVPDVAMDAAYLHDPYLYCTGDVASTGVSGSCSSGFLDSTGKVLTTAGGTSFATPIFAGILALINQKQNATGQGLINPILYGLAANQTVYTKAFHDITTGNNYCNAGSAYCLSSGSSSGYPAGTGYDPVTGLGTVDAYNLASVWPSGASGTQSTLASSVTAFTSSTASTVPLSQSVIFTVSVTGANDTPTGKVNFTLDGTVVASPSLSNGTASYSATFTTAGNHVIAAVYSGDAIYAASSASYSINVLSSAGSFSFTAASTSITLSSSTTCTDAALDGNGYNTYCDVLTVTPSNGYTGSIDFQATTTDPTLASEGCWNWDQAIVNGSGTTSGTIYISVNSTFCNSNGVVLTGSRRPNQHFKLAQKTGMQLTSRAIGKAGLWSISLILVALLGIRVRKLRGLASLLVLVALGVGISACGGGSSSSSGSATTSAGGVSVVVTGTDTVSPSLTSSTTLSVVVQ